MRFSPLWRTTMRPCRSTPARVSPSARCTGASPACAPPGSGSRARRWGRNACWRRWGPRSWIGPTSGPSSTRTLPTSSRSWNPYRDPESAAGGEGRKLFHERHLGETEADEERPQGLLGRGARPRLELFVRGDFPLERGARQLEELGGLLGVEVRADDLRLGWLQLDLHLDRRQDGLDAPTADAQGGGVALR